MLVCLCTATTVVQKVHQSLWNWNSLGQAHVQQCCTNNISLNILYIISAGLKPAAVAGSAVFSSRNTVSYIGNVAGSTVIDVRKRTRECTLVMALAVSSAAIFV